MRDPDVSSLRRVQLHPRDMELARLIAAYLELRPVEHQGVEPRRSDQGRGPGHGRLHGGKGERGTPVVIEDGHAAEQELRPQALPIGVDGADGDALAQRARGDSLDVALVCRDLGEDVIAQKEQRTGEQQVEAEQDPAGDSSGRRPPAPRRDGFVDRFLDRLLELL